MKISKGTQTADRPVCYQADKSNIIIGNNFTKFMKISEQKLTRFRAQNAIESFRA